MKQDRIHASDCRCKACRDPRHAGRATFWRAVIVIYLAIAAGAVWFTIGGPGQ